ncbi:hypothetical protein D5086_020292 [Populus alba]|uniref:Uncharacterized protein n=1 Tax=Populus alba TaxID=43335 RepID=A0ACC4BJL8_POPAL
MLLLSITLVTTSLQHHNYHDSNRSTRFHQPLKVVGMAKETTDDSGNGIIEKAAISGGSVSAPAIAWSF